MTLKTPYLSDCAVHRVPLHKSTRLPASKSTSTKTIFSFQFYTIVNQYRNLDFDSFNPPLLSTHRESDWELAKFHLFPLISRPVTCLPFRT